jgi:FAD/FMN-containing dehydrogenase
METNFISHLIGAFPPNFLSQDPHDLEHYGKDWTKVFPAKPSAIVFPRTTEEVSRFLKLCSEHKLAVVPSGGRTGLSGGAVAAKGEVVLSLAKMNRIGAVDLLSLTLPVEAGAITEAVHHHCEPHGLTWPVDFGSKGSSCVGGNISTNAGGINVIRFGMTRHWVLGLTVVLMNGTILRLNGSLEKNNTGLDLKHLFIGSEGTLGVVTEAVLKLTRLDQDKSLFFFGAKDLTQVFHLLEAARKAPFEICAFEAFSRNCFEATTKLHSIRSPFTSAHEQYVLVEVKSGEAETWLEDIFSRELVEEGVQAKSQEEVKTFWKTRETISESLRAHGELHTSDISVPVSALKGFIEEWQEIFAKRFPDWELFIFGHFGDGNLHIHALKPGAMAQGEFLRQNLKVEEDLFEVVGKYEGSISAEHGIGLLKKEHLHLSKSVDELAIMRALKKILDPQGLLNPGKVFDL